MTTPKKKKTKKTPTTLDLRGYDAVLADITKLLEAARRTSARTVNAIMTATYWQIGRRRHRCFAP